MLAILFIFDLLSALGRFSLMLSFPCHLFFSFSWIEIQLKEEWGTLKTPFLTEPVLVQVEEGLWSSHPTDHVAKSCLLERQAFLSLSVLGTLNEIELGNWKMVDCRFVNPEIVSYGLGGENSLPKAFAGNITIVCKTCTCTSEGRKILKQMWKKTPDVL